MGDLTPPGDERIRREMRRVGRRMWARGLCAGCEGNFSVRVDDDRVLCTPSGVSKGSVRPDTVRAVALDGTPLDEGRLAVTSEIRVHLAVYRARPDVRAVVHSHAPRATAFALSGIPLPEGIYPEAEVVLGRVPLVPYARPGTAALADNVARALTPSTTALLLAQHGTLTLSTTDLTDAFQRLEVLDSYCEILLAVARLGRVEVLTPAQVAEVAGPVRAQATIDARNRAAFAALGLRPVGHA